MWAGQIFWCFVVFMALSVLSQEYSSTFLVVHLQDIFEKNYFLWNSQRATLSRSRTGTSRLCITWLTYRTNMSLKSKKRNQTECFKNIQPSIPFERFHCFHRTRKIKHISQILWVSGCHGNHQSLTFIFIFDGKAEDVSCSEARAVVHTAVKQRMRVRILDIENLPRGGNMTSDALIRRDTKLFLYKWERERFSLLFNIIIFYIWIGTNKRWYKHKRDICIRLNHLNNKSAVQRQIISDVSALNEFKFICNEWIINISVVKYRNILEAWIYDTWLRNEDIINLQ